MLELNGTFREFLDSFFGFLSELLQEIFTFLSGFFEGLHINLT